MAISPAKLHLTSMDLAFAHATGILPRMIPMIVALLILAWTPPFAAAAAKQPITHETMWAMKRVGAPAPSPDGKWVVMPVVEPSYDPKEQVSDLWIAPMDGSAAPVDQHQERRERRGMVARLTPHRLCGQARRG